MKSIGWQLKVLVPGGDDSSSGGGGDLGAAQNSLEVWTDTGNRCRSLGAEWTRCCPYDLY